MNLCRSESDDHTADLIRCLQDDQVDFTHRAAVTQYVRQTMANHYAGLVLARLSQSARFRHATRIMHAAGLPANTNNSEILLIELTLCCFGRAGPLAVFPQRP